MVPPRFRVSLIMIECLDPIVLLIMTKKMSFVNSGQVFYSSAKIISSSENILLEKGFSLSQNQSWRLPQEQECRD